MSVSEGGTSLPIGSPAPAGRCAGGVPRWRSRPCAADLDAEGPARVVGTGLRASDRRDVPHRLLQAVEQLGRGGVGGAGARARPARARVAGLLPLVQDASAVPFAHAHLRRDLPDGEALSAQLDDAVVASVPCRVVLMTQVSGQSDRYPTFEFGRLPWRATARSAILAPVKREALHAPLHRGGPRSLGRASG